MGHEFSKKSEGRLSGVSPELQAVARLAIKRSKVDFGIPETGGRRTVVRQRELYDAGLSKCDGTTNRSNHQDGKALDFYAYVNGKASWEPEHLAQVACAFLEAAIELGIKIKWGGLFNSFLDMPHVELYD